MSKKVEHAVAQIKGKLCISILKNSPESWETEIIDVKTSEGIIFEVKTKSDIKNNIIIGIINDVSIIDERGDLAQIYCSILPDWNLGTSVSISFFGENKGIMKKIVVAPCSQQKKTFSLKVFSPRRFFRKIRVATLRG